MPQRRKTKVAKAKRPKPKVPAGDEGCQLSRKTRSEKLETLLKDFDQEVSVRIREMETYRDNLIKEINRMVTLEIMKIPSHLRDMTVADYLKSGGQINGMTDTEDVLEYASTVESKFKTRPKQKTGTKMPYGKGWETPAMTPRFDPRLPKTPAVLRNAKPGERVITLSLAGSPLANKPSSTVTRPECVVPLNKSKTLVVTEDTDVNMDDIAGTELDAESMEKLRLIQLKIGNILKRGQAKLAASTRH